MYDRPPRTEQAASPFAAEPLAPRLTWRDPALRGCLLLALALQLWTLACVDGYQLGDSVEYLDRAEMFVHGTELHGATVRSFAFSALLTPLFALERAFDLSDARLVVGAARAVQMLLGAWALVVTARVAERSFGRLAGRAAAFALACQPIFLRYSIEPLSATAAMLGCAQGAWHLFEPGGFQRGLKAGAWLGGAVLMAFQCIPIVLALVAVSALLHTRRRARFVAGWAGGLALLVLVQCVLDKLVYGSFGTSLGAYVVENVGYNVATLLRRVGLESASRALYEAVAALDRGEDVVASATPSQLRSLKSPWFYFVELPRQAMAWPMIALVALGLARSLVRPAWITSSFVLLLAANVLFMSLKGEKTFRLWMPLLPFFCVLAGAGVAWLCEPRAARRAFAATREEALRARAGVGLGRVRATCLALLCAALVVLSLRVLAQQNLRKYGGYWRAIEVVNRTASDEHASPEQPQTVGSVYHWATQFRARRGVQQIKLPHHLDQWRALDDAQRAEVIRQIATYEWLIGHLQAFRQDRALMQAINARYAIVQVIYDRAAFDEMDPIYVLRAKEHARGARTFFELHEGVDPSAYQAALSQPVSVDYRRRMSGGGVQQIVLLGWDVERESAENEREGLFWITYHWFAGPLGGHDYTIADRFTDPRGGAFQNNHAPAYGCLPTSEWKPGSILRETWLLRMPDDPIEFGGPWRRGTLLPLGLWIALPEYDASDNVIGGLVPFRASGASPYPRGKTHDPASKKEGRRWSDDGFMQIGGFALPLAPDWRLADDGRTIPEAGAAAQP